MQGVREITDLRPRPHTQPMQAVWGSIDLPARPYAKPMQGVWQGSTAVDAADASNAGSATFGKPEFRCCNTAAGSQPAVSYLVS